MKDSGLTHNMPGKIILTVLVIVSCLHRLPAQINLSASGARYVLSGKTDPSFSGDSIDVHYYKLQLAVSDITTTISGSATVMATAVSDNADSIFLSLINEMTVDSVLQDGQPCLFQHNGDSLRIRLNVPVMKGDKVNMEVFYGGTVPSSGFFSGMTSRKDDIWNQNVTWTLSEPFAAADWFPCKQDLADKADSVSVWITVKNGLRAGSNGVLAGTDTLPDNNVRFRWEHRHPIDYYLISLAVSSYREVLFYAQLPGGNDSVPVVNYIYSNPDYLTAFGEDIHRTADFISLFSGLYIPYPYADEKYGHCLAPIGGGMEHQTMTTLAGFDFGLVSHELTHQWFGDYVTCATWQDIWINEGFASYGEYLALEHLASRQEADDWMSNAHSRAMQEPYGSIYIPFAGANDVFRIFDGNLSYKKGASVIHMIRYELNDDSLFFTVLRHFLTAYGDSVATGNDFRTSLEEVTGQDYGWFFDQWYYGQGYPSLSVNWSQVPDSLILELSQTGSSPVTPFFSMHLDVKIHTVDKDTLIRIFQVQPLQRFAIPFSEEALQVTIDPDQWLLLDVTGVSHVPQEKTGQEIILYPNPVAERLTVLLMNPLTEMHIMIYDLQGRVVMQTKASGRRIVIPVTGLPTGLYFIHIQSGNKVLIKKFAVNRN